MMGLVIEEVGQRVCDARFRGNGSLRGSQRLLSISTSLFANTYGNGFAIMGSRLIVAKLQAWLVRLLTAFQRSRPINLAFNPLHVIRVIYA